MKAKDNEKAFQFWITGKFLLLCKMSIFLICIFCNLLFLRKCCIGLIITIVFIFNCKLVFLFSRMNWQLTIHSSELPSAGIFLNTIPNCVWKKPPAAWNTDPPSSLSFWSICHKVLLKSIGNASVDLKNSVRIRIRMVKLFGVLFAYFKSLTNQMIFIVMCCNRYMTEIIFQ